MNATSHHADEEGESEIRSTAEESSSFLEDIFDGVVPTRLPIWLPATSPTLPQIIVDDSEVPVLAIDADKLKKIKAGSIKTVGGKKFRLKRGITMDIGVHYNVMPRRMAGNEM